MRKIGFSLALLLVLASLFVASSCYDLTPTPVQQTSGTSGSGGAGGAGGAGGCGEGGAADAGCAGGADAA